VSADASDLLRLLGSGVRPVDGARRAAPAAADVSKGDFASLLARAGELAAGRPVDLAPDVGARLELTADQKSRLAEAVDRAELSGVRRALVLLDGQELVVDVADRIVLFDEAMGEQGLVSKIDGVVRAQPSSDAADGDATVGREGMKLSGRSLLDLLGGSGN